MQGTPHYTTWYTFWTEAVAVVGMCVAQGLDGGAIVEGMWI